jgi:hypothetical protein
MSIHDYPCPLPHFDPPCGHSEPHGVGQTCFLTVTHCEARDDVFAIINEASPEDIHSIINPPHT